MLALLRQRNFALLWTAGLISLLGDHLLGIALPFYVYEHTGSVLATGAMAIAGIAPRILLGSIAGVFVDRWDQKWTMVITDLVRFIILLFLLVVQSPEWFWIIYLVIFVQAAISQFFDPAKSAILPRVVGKDHLMAANSLDSMSNEFARLVGPPLGGALLGILGLTSVVLLDSMSFLISGLMLMFIVVSSLPSTNSEKQKRNSSSSITSTVRVTIEESVKFWQEWLAGLRLVRKEKLIATLFFIEGIAMVAEGIIDVLWIVFVQEIIQSSSLEFGWLSAVFALGSLLGGFIIGQMNKASPTRLIVFGSTAIGVIWLAMINIPTFPLALIFLFLNGIVAMGYWVSMRTLLQINIAERYRGRVFGAYNTTNSLMRLSGMGLAIVLGDRLGTSPMLNVAAGLLVLTGTIALIKLSGHRLKSSVSGNR